jgi:hypothetical protein
MGNMEIPNQAGYPVLGCSFNFIASTLIMNILAGS